VGETIASIGEGAATADDGGGGGDAEEETESQASGAEREPGRGAEDAAASAEAETATAQAEPEPEPEPAAEEEPQSGPEPEPEPAPQPEPEPEPEPEPAAAEAGEDGSGNGRIKASPVARRMARELGLELARLEGTGPGGRIVKADVEAAASGGGGASAPAAERGTAEPAEAEAPAHEQAAPAKAEPEAPERDVPGPVVAGDGQTGRGETTTQNLTRLQQTVARRMAESKATAPEFVLNVDVEMDAAVELRKQLKAAAGEGGTAPSFNDFVVKASALALSEFPRANGAYRDGKFELYSRVNVGVAVAGQDALVVPTVFDADRKSLGQIARESRQLAERVRAGAITPPELSSGTFTVSNLGMFGIDHFVAVINPPQAAILAVGAMKPTPVVVDGEVTVRTLMKLTLACDHRILYGADAAEFLARIRELLQTPLRLAL
jgi:pyruvate dehydrogenase E2 component (dihydrolipoamide acetyltransferase)